MTTPTQRFEQAHRYAVALGNAAYAQAGPENEAKADAYYKTYQREMLSFLKLEAMRWPHPDQRQIDAESVDLLLTTSDHICPECFRTTAINRCPVCDWDGDYSVDA